MGPVDYYCDAQGIGQLILNRPGALNALNWEAMRGFRDRVVEAESDSGLHVLIVRGNGRAFCAGGDLFELHNYLSRADGERLSAIMTDALDKLEVLRCPTIAAIEGPAMGGGAEIALACDLRVMSSSATLGLMHVRLAITPAWGGARRLVRLVGYARAMEWSAVGRVLEADDAHAAGLASRLAPNGRALESALELAKELNANNPDAVADVKRVILDAANGNQEGNLEARVFADRWASYPHVQASEKFVAARRQRQNGHS